ncbi:Regulatory-associated protein of mTOR [Galdieria sulphuraria]|nr:Regulatory-associated protein of mTOR [Galdieria sulphuraria]
MAQLREHGTEIWKYLDEKHLEALEVSLATKTAGLSYTGVVENWRIRHRVKISSVGLVLCLSEGPQLYEEGKPNPCATLECWIDPLKLGSQRPSEVVSAALQGQYERWQPKAQYHLVAEPTLDDVHKLCLQLRSEAKDERVLFHYNGHGVPRPTATGEIYLFSENFTHYVQLSLFELQSWLGTPSAFVFDCSNAGLILSSFLEFAKKRDKLSPTSNAVLDEVNDIQVGNEKEGWKNELKSFSDSIIFASCGAEETLPTNPYFPADILTSCLTTPIQMAFRWFLPRSLVSGVRLEMLDRIPGKVNDKKTMFGELNWVFTAVTDCIAWNSLPRALFHKLFRQDLLVASLFRNFLLAERILKSLNCTPITNPQLPPMNHHRLWHAWDYMMELCLAQLPSLLSTDEKKGTEKDYFDDENLRNNEEIRRDIILGERMNTSASYISIPFFEHQLSAFETWLTIESEKPTVPEQLPIVLQVLLSQNHRKRALTLIGRFLELGDWAVDLTLSVGVFPYILKLLQSSSMELKKELVFIWGKIICQDRSCVADLVREKGHIYMLDFLDTDEEEAYESQVMALFILSVVSGFAPKKLIESRALDTVMSKAVFSKDTRVRRWSFLFFSKFMKNYPPIAEELFENDDFIRTTLTVLRSDEAPANRASVLYFLEFLPPGMPFQLELYEDFLLIRDLGVDLGNIALGFIISIIEEKSDDASPLVRREVVKLTARTIKTLYDGDPKKVGYSMERNLVEDPLGTFLLQVLLYLSGDPQIEVSSFASEIYRDLAETSFRNERQGIQGRETKSISENYDGSAKSFIPDIKNASLPRVVSLEGIAQQMEAFKIHSTMDDDDVDYNDIEINSQNGEKQSQHIGNAWRLPSLYDWSQGEIMNLRISESLKGGQSPQSIFENLYNQNKQMVYLPDIIDEGYLLSDKPVYVRWHHMENLQEQVTIDLGGSPVTCVKFSPMCSQLIIGTRNGEWSEWNPENGIQQLTASCGDREICAMRVIGEAGGRITSYTRYVLLTACSDSTIMLWRVDRYNQDIRMVFSCRCWSQFDDMEENIDYSKANISKKFAMSWEPYSARIATNRRNPGVIRFWDLPQEMCFARCRVPLDSCINSLTWTGSIANMGPQCLFGGTDNGSLFTVDLRTQNSIESVPIENSIHNDAIVRVLGQASSTGGHLLSASKDGVVCVWDPRKLSTGLETISTLQLGQVGFLSAHTCLPMFACRTTESNVDIFNTKENSVVSIYSSNKA